MLVISKFLFVFLSSWYDCRHWANVEPTLASFRKSAALRQRFANRNKKFEQQLHLPFFNNISDFEIVHFFYYRDLNFAVGPTLYSGWYYHSLNVAVGPTFDSLKKSTTMRRHFANRNKTIS